MLHVVVVVTIFVSAATAATERDSIKTAASASVPSIRFVEPLPNTVFKEPSIVAVTVELTDEKDADLESMELALYRNGVLENRMEATKHATFDLMDFTETENFVDVKLLNSQSSEIVAEAWTSFQVVFRDVAAAALAREHAHNLIRTGEVEEALATLEEAIELDWTDYLIRYQYAFYLHLAHNDLRALHVAREALPLAREESFEAFSMVITLSTQICEWSRWDTEVMELFPTYVHRALALHRPIMEPFFQFTLPVTPLEMLQQATYITAEVRRRVPQIDAALFHREEIRADGGKLRVGYWNMGGFSGQVLSIARFMQAFLALHDRNKTEVYCYSDSWDLDDGKVFARCQCQNYFHVNRLSPENATELILSHKLHVFVETAGFSWQGFQNRNAFFSRGFDMMIRRVAPVQMTFHGYPGSHGNGSYDYSTFDVVSCPPEMSVFVGEKLALHSVAYLVSEHSTVNRFVIGDDPQVEAEPPKASIGLPDDKFIFASFNREVKYTPDLWRCWMEILHKVPDSVLWVMRFDEMAFSHLLYEARKHGIDSSRIISTSRFPTRRIEYTHKSLADLFLDTPLFNGHTTVLDALWCGVPVLTLPGEMIASRVAAALLNANDTPLTIVRTMEEYADMAVNIAKNRNIHRRLKDKFKESRWTAPLWNMTLWTSEFERLHRNAYEVSQSSNSFYHIW